MRHQVLKQILNYQRLKLAKGEMIYAERAIDSHRAFASAVNAQFELDKDGHSGGSYAWVKRQSMKIDEIGWDAWLQTDDAKGGYLWKERLHLKN